MGLVMTRFVLLAVSVSKGVEERQQARLVPPVGEQTSEIVVDELMDEILKLRRLDLNSSLPRNPIAEGYKVH